MTGFDEIVVALGSPEGDHALMVYAALLARLAGTREVRIVHVANATADAAGMRRAMRARAAEAFAGSTARIECDVLQGALTDRLLAYVAEFQADLILIGAKKHKLGARLAMVAPCSVAVVPNGSPAKLSHLLIAFDFSASAADTLQWATGLAAGDRTIQCTALHVVTHESTDLFAGQEGDAEQAELMRKTLASANRHGVDVTPRLAGVTRSTEVGRSHPFSLAASIQGSDIAHTILSEAEKAGADCIALSTRGRSRSASILLGSVTEKVIERATMPLLVGKHAGASLGLVSILLGQAGHDPDIKTN